MITIIGAAHVFDISQRIEKEIKERNPPVVAVELDRKRYIALKSGEKKGKPPFIYRLLQLVQERMARKFGVEVGEEMLTAVDTAEEVNSQVAFIDLPADQVLSKLMDEMSIKEKISMIFSGIVGLFISKDRVEKEMERYYSNEGNSGKSIQQQAPNVARILIKDRNDHMSKNLKELEDRFGSVLAVVGDAHVPGMVRELKERDLQILRLEDIQKGEEEPSYEGSNSMENDEDNTEVSFSYNFKVE